MKLNTEQKEILREMLEKESKIRQVLYEYAIASGNTWKILECYRDEIVPFEALKIKLEEMCELC